MKKFLFVPTIIISMFLSSGYALAAADGCCAKASCTCGNGGCCVKGNCTCKGDCCVKGGCHCADGKCNTQCDCQKK